MWTLSAPFDIDLQTLTGPTISKLLKPGKAYPTGRKDVSLIINSNKISRGVYAEFAVDPFTVDQVADPATRPKLTFTNQNQKGKLVHLHRGDDSHPINPNSTKRLRDGDVIVFSKNVQLTVKWESICCYIEPSDDTEYANSCAALGIHLVHKPHPDVTHHITDTVEPTFTQALSLLAAANFVTSAWLDELIRLGDLPADSDPSVGLSLEKNFSAIPAPAKYRPAFAPELSAEHRELATWEPNEGRMKMFAKYRFILMAEGSRNTNSDLRDLIVRGEGHPEACNVSEGPEKLRGVIVRGKAKLDQKLVLLADADACKAAVGKEIWKEINDTAEAFQLQILSAQDVLAAVLNADASSIESSEPSAPLSRAPSSSPLPDFVPNTHAEESSIVPNAEEEPEPEKPVRRLTRRTASRQASQEPDPSAPPPKRHLTRRAQPTGHPIITGLDDSSVVLNNLTDTTAGAASLAPIQSTKPRSRLKRRVGVDPDPTVEPSQSIFNALERDTSEEPPLKKFKALFDASDPTRSGAESFVQQSGAFTDEEMMVFAGVGSQSQSQTQSQTQSGSSGKRAAAAAAGSALGAVPEEEEEASQMPGLENQVGQKRKERGFDELDVEMADATPATKRRAVADNAVQRAAPPPAPKPTASTAAKVLPATKSAAAAKEGAAAGAPAGKPDTDSAFLKAIASTKRGKKTEDDFDRDFNKLKISKSDLRAAADEERESRPEWELLDRETFGDDGDLRGNFMVIHEIDVFKVDRGQTGRRRAAGTDPRWEGKPDFKKFKKQTSFASQKKVIELFVSEDNDTGVGPGYWKGDNSQDRSDDDFDATQTKSETQPVKKKAPARTQPATRSKGGQSQATQAMIIDDSSDEGVAARPKAKRTTTAKPPSKTATAAEPPKKRTTRAASKTPASLFIDDESDDDKAVTKVLEDDGRTMDDEDFDAGQTLQSSAEATMPPTRRSTKRALPIIVDDGDEDGAVFAGFGKRKTRRS